MKSRKNIAIMKSIKRVNLKIQTTHSGDLNENKIPAL